MGHFDHEAYVETTIHFKCNLKCEHCMIEGSMNWLQPQSAENFQQLLDYNAATAKWKGLILTGAEITLRKDIPDLARSARQHGFEHVRIQTHGMRLADAAYCRELVEAGVDEYFVSLTAADKQTHDSITRSPGSFEQTLTGLENLDTFDGIVTLTNTVVTARNYKQLPSVVDRLSHLKNLVQMDFWHYWPMSESDGKDLIARHTDVLPFLRSAIAKAKKYGRAVEVKNFPECLLAEDGTSLDNNQPKLFIDPNFWPEFQLNGFQQCVHRKTCDAVQCLGLNTAYVKKFGWQENVLTPITIQDR